MALPRINFKRRDPHWDNEEEWTLRIGTNKYKILRQIHNSGNRGLRYSEILRFIIEKLKGWTFNSYEHRGYYADALLQNTGDASTSGLLKTYCSKNENGRWVISNDTLKDHFISIENPIYKAAKSMLGLPSEYSFI